MKKIMNRIVIAGFVIAFLFMCVPCSMSVLPPEDEVGSISVSSSPSGATVSLEGFVGPISKTPYTFTKVPVGTHKIELSLEGYQDWTTSVDVTSNCTSYVHATLIPVPTPTPTPPATGSISVSSDPSGANVYLDDVYKGITPLTISDVSPGTHTVKLKLEGYHDAHTDVKVTAGSTAYDHVSLKHEETTGSISVKSDPSGANVYLDNAYKGLTPLTISDVSQGYRNIELTRDGYKNWYTTVEVKAGKTADVSTSLKPTPQATGSISAASVPSGASVYVDGRYRGRTPELVTGLSSGYHTLRIELDGYYRWERSDIDVTAGGTSYISASLTPMPYPTTGAIYVSSSPSNAYIYMDGSYKGNTPKTITDVSPGAHTVELEHSGYYDWTNTVRVTAGSTSYVSPILTRNPSPTTGCIAVSSSPAGANVYLNGAYQGSTSASGDFVIAAVTPGHHTVLLTLSGYQNWEAGVDVTAGESSHVSASLVSASPSSSKGTISVSSSPSGAGVYIDDAYKGITPLTISEVEPGTHTISVKLKGYEDWSTSEQVTAGGTASVLASLASSSTPTPKTPTTVFCLIVAIAISGIIAVTKRRERK